MKVDSEAIDRLIDAIKLEREEAFEVDAAAPPPPLPPAGGGGSSGGMSDDWKASVDRQLGQLHGDVRALLNRGVAAVVALAILVGGLYLYTNQKFEAAAERDAAMQVEMAKMNGKIDQLLERTGPAKP